MKILNCNNIEFEQIKMGKQLYKIFDKDYELEYLEDCILKSDTGEQLNIQITSVKQFLSINDILNTINFEKFGPYSNKDDFIKFVEQNYNLKENIFVCRIKNKSDLIFNIEDEQLIELIDIDSIEQNKLGLSGCQTYTVSLKNNTKAILKIQNIVGVDTLEEEYKVLKYLDKKINVAKVFYYNKLNNVEYLLRECVEGEPLYKYKGFGFELGKELKKFHNLCDKKCSFKKFNTDSLLENALKNIDVVHQSRIKKFEKYTKEELIEFLIKNKPEDDALIHGDFSLTNILKNEGLYYYIDLGNMSISTKYFDIYVLKKSLKINNLEEEFDNFIKGYNIDDYNEIYLDWMSLIESSYT